MRKSTMVFEKVRYKMACTFTEDDERLEIWIWNVEELYYPCSENKDADLRAKTKMLICTFVFAYVAWCFCHGAAHL